MQSDSLEWSSIFKRLFFTVSSCDQQYVKPSDAAPPAGPEEFICFECSGHPRFGTRQGLLQHARIKHKRRSGARMFVSASGICPGCQTDFKQRFRDIAHLSDARRPCHAMMLRGAFQAVGDSEFIESLDQLDREGQKLARRSVGAATKSAGKKIGFARH